MKDMYSFDVDEAGLEASYQAMYRAYNRVFSRCGLQFRPVEADSGAIGGNASQEFMVLAENGEAQIVYCDTCNYAANIEKATSQLTNVTTDATALPALQKVATPERKTIDEVAEFLQLAPEKIVKTLFYGTEQGYLAVLIRGNDQVNEIKLGNLVGGNKLYLAPPQEIAEVLGLPVGYVGPINLDPKIKVLADLQVQVLHQVVVGANESGYHLLNVEPQRDLGAITYVDLRMVQPGETCPHCQGKLQGARGIEVGQIFKLGTKYSKALNAVFLDESGKSRLMIMGCYGIGVSRTLAATIEQNYDQNGIKWPLAIAPYQVHLIPVSADQLEVANQLYQQLNAAQIEVLLDDRNERPGVKFKDADLIGIPLRITIGPKGLVQGEVEVKFRHDGADTRWPLEQVVAEVQAFLTNTLR